MLIKKSLSASSVGLLGLCALLSACNDSSDNRAPEPSPANANTLVLSDENAAEALRLTLMDMPYRIPGTVFELIMYTSMGASRGSCVNDPEGTMESAMTGERPDRVLFDNCLVEDFYEMIFADGLVRFSFDNEEQLSPFTMTMEDYSLRTLYSDPYSEETFTANGTAHITPSPYGSGISGIRDLSGTLTTTYRQGDSQSPEQVSANWSFKDFNLEIGEGGRGPESLTMNGQLGSDTPLQGSVTVTTHITLYHSHDDMAINCPDSGDVTIEGSEGTSLNLAITDNETILVTLNGVTQTYDCDGFLAWAGGSFIF